MIHPMFILHTLSLHALTVLPCCVLACLGSSSYAGWCKSFFFFFFSSRERVCRQAYGGIARFVVWIFFFIFIIIIVLYIRFIFLIRNDLFLIILSEQDIL